MLTPKIRIILIVFILLSYSYIFNLIRKKHLELRYALIWLFTGFVILILTLFPGLIDWLAEIIGIYNPINMLLFLGLLLSLTIIFSLTIFASRMSIRIKELTQTIALKDEEIMKLIKNK